MRALFLLVVLANCAFFAWAQFFSEADTQSDPRPLARQIAPEKLRILPPEPLKASPQAAPKPVAEAGTPRIACMEWGGLFAADTERAGEALTGLSLGNRLSQRQVDDNARWWVFIGPRGTRQDAQKKAAELKGLGVDDYFILQDESPMRFALSLGVFKTEAAAANRLEALRAKGVKTAQLGARETQVQKTFFQVRSVEDALAAKLREIAQGFAGTEVRECAAGPG